MVAVLAIPAEVAGVLPGSRSASAALPAAATVPDSAPATTVAAAQPAAANTRGLGWGGISLQEPSISSDGRAIALIATLGPSSPVPGLRGKILRDDTYLLVTQPSTLAIPVDPAGKYVKYPSQPSVSAGGRYVAFTAFVAGDDANRSPAGIYRADLSTGAVVRVSTNAIAGENAGQPSISDDGRYIAYVQQQDQRGEPDVGFGTPTRQDVWLWDGQLGQADRLGGASDSQEYPAISGDGSVVAFTSQADLLPNAPSDADDRRVVATWDRESQQVKPLYDPARSQRGSSIANPKAVSTTGRYVALVASGAAELVPEAPFADDNNATDALVFDRAADTFRVGSLTDDKKSTCKGSSTNAAVDAKGDVIFTSSCTNLGAGTDVSNNFGDIYLSPADGSPSRLLSANYRDAPARSESTPNDRPSLSADGGQAVFHSFRKVGADASQSTANARCDCVNFAGDVPDGTGLPFGERVASGLSAAQACPSTTYPAATDTATVPSGQLAVANPRLDFNAKLTVADGQLSGSGNRAFRALVVESRAGKKIYDYGALTPDPAGWKLSLDVTTGESVTVTYCVPATPNLAPQPERDQVEVAAGRSKDVDVLSNDVGDPDPAKLTVTLASGTYPSIDTLGLAETSSSCLTSRGWRTLRDLVNSRSELDKFCPKASQEMVAKFGGHVEDFVSVVSGKIKVTATTPWVGTRTATYTVSAYGGKSASSTLAITVGAPRNEPPPSDLSVQLSTPGPAYLGLTTTVTATVANAGDEPIATPARTLVRLPTGFTVDESTATSGDGWTCGGSKPDLAECVYAGLVAAHGTSSSLTVPVRVAPSASPGNVSAAVLLAGDGGDPQYSATLALTVRSADLDDTDARQLVLEVDNPGELPEKSTVSMAMRLRSFSDHDVGGPQTIAVTLPNGMPAGLTVTAARQSGDGWACDSTPLGPTVMLQCTTQAGIAAKKASADLTLKVTGTAVVAGSTVDLPFTYSDGSSRVTQSERLTAVPPRIARLSLTAAAPVPLTAGQSSDLTVNGVNVGNGNATGASLDITLPDKVTIGEVVGTGWECQPQDAIQRCVTSQAVLPRAALTPLVLKLNGAKDLGNDTVPVEVAGAFNDTDGKAKAVAELLTIPTAAVRVLGVEREKLAETTGDDRVAKYSILVNNAGDREATGTLELTESLPAGTAVKAEGNGWKCTTGAAAFTCTSPKTTLDVGAAAPAVTVTATFPVVLSGGQAQLAATAELGDFTGARAAAIAVPQPAPAVAEIEATVTESRPELTRGNPGSLTLSAHNAGAVTSTGGITVGLVMPRGLTPTKATGDGWTCRLNAMTGQGAVACRRPGSLAAGTDAPPATVQFTVQSSAPDEAVLTVGTLPGTELGALLNRLVGEGSAVLTAIGTETRPVVGLKADAGTDLQISERTPTDAGGSEATKVLLDGRGSSAGVEDLSWSWRQTAGPPVVWTDVKDAKVPITGPRPAFTVPRLAAEGSSVTLTFELTVTAGDAKATDTIDVVLTPTPDGAPVLGDLSADSGSTKAPADGAKVKLSLPVRDPEGDPVTVAWSIVDTNGSSGSATTRADGKTVGSAGGTSNAEMLWPTGASYAVVQAVTTSSRGAVTTASLAIGDAPAPPTVTLKTPAEVDSGASVTAKATVAAGPKDGLTWTWRQISGPLVDAAALAAAKGPTATFPAPSVADDGQVLVLSVVANRWAGLATTNAAATASIRVRPLALPTLSVAGKLGIAKGASTELTVKGAPEGSAFAWSQRSGPAGAIGSADQAKTTFSAPSDGVAVLAVGVTDPSGRVTALTVEVKVGTAAAPGGSAAACSAAESVIRQALDAAAQHRALALSVGPVSLDLGTLDAVGGCDGDSPSVSVKDAGFSVAGGVVTGKGLSGTITPEKFCLTSGTLGFPDSWGVSQAEVGSGAPICVDLTPGAENPVTGSFKVTGLPLLNLPDGVAKPTIAVSFDGTSIDLKATIGLPNGGSGALSMAVETATGNYSGKVSGAFQAFGNKVELAGSLSYDGTKTSASASGFLPGPITLVPGATASESAGLLECGRAGGVRKGRDRRRAAAERLRHVHRCAELVDESVRGQRQ